MPGVFPRKAYRGSPESLTIRLTRLKAGLSREEAAKLAGVSFTAWSRYEAGSRRMPFKYWQAFLEAAQVKPVK
jgi:transcriptional regulator with XRE-family HTH domain